MTPVPAPDGCLALDCAVIGAGTAVPAITGAVAPVASLYEYQAQHAEETTFALPGGGRSGLAWMQPRSHAELVQRRRAMERVAERSCGMMGRSPDHVGATFGGLHAGPACLARR